MIVGIDLGTTNSLIGCVREGVNHLFPDEDGNLLLPSVVALGDGDRLVVGRRALNRRLLEPSRAVAQVKRKMGSAVRSRFGPHELSPPEVSALILGALLDRVEASTETRPEAAIITVPAYFDDLQREATRDAGELAGLRVERLVNEPTAAALTHTSGGEERVLVYDFGGGTFDVSVLERDEGFLEVCSSDGDTRLGGADIDEALLEHALRALGSRADAVRRDAAGMARLGAAMERAKIALSTRAQVDVFEPQLIKDVHLEMSLGRADLERLAAPFVARSLRSVDRALASVGWPPDSLDRVLLVGGMSQMPLVEEMVGEHLGRAMSKTEEPELAVARGAAMLAGRADGVEVDEVLVDVTPHTLAVAVRGRDGEFQASPIIPRQSAVPVSRTRTFFTGTDGQPIVEVPVLQGEAIQVEDNAALGQVVIEHLPPSPAGSPVDVSLRLDISGLLHASAVHVLSGREAEVTIRRGPAALTRTEKRRARERIALIEQPGERDIDGVDEEQRRLASALLERADRVIDRSESPSPELEALKGARTELATALESGEDSQLLAELVDSLSGALLDLM